MAGNSIKHVSLNCTRGYQCPKCGHKKMANAPLPLMRGFYEELFGFRMVYNADETWKLGETKTELKISKLKLPFDRAMLELVEGDWGEHICLEVDEFPENLHLIDLQRVDKSHKDLEVKFCTDLVGNVIELVKRGKK